MVSWVISFSLLYKQFQIINSKFFKFIVKIIPDYVPNNIRANHIKTKLVPFNIKMKLVSYNIKIKPNTRLNNRTHGILSEN